MQQSSVSRIFSIVDDAIDEQNVKKKKNVPAIPRMLSRLAFGITYFCYVNIQSDTREWATQGSDKNEAVNKNTHFLSLFFLCFFFKQSL